MKKLLSLTLALAIIICAVPLGTFTLTASAETSGYYTYIVTYGEAIITDVDTSISGYKTIPSTLGGYPVTGIDDGAFWGCTSLTSITIPDSVTSIGWNAFKYCYNLTNITIPDSVTRIGGRAFEYCKSLTNITIPDSVTSIGLSAFYYCESLTSVTIPDSVTSIDDNVFDYCTSLTEIVVSKNNNKYSSQDGVLFNKDKTILIQYPIGKTNTSYIIPNSVTSIGDYAFYYCESLTNITIPDSVTSIGVWAFRYCESLTNITIPDSVTSIGDEAFRSCTGLTNITIPDSVTSIGSYAFYNTAYYNDKNNWENKVLYIGKHLIFAKRDISGEYTIKTGALTIADEAFYECTGLTNITIPDSVTSIGFWAFCDCKSLTNITIPDSVTSIGEEAFHSCTGLTNITIPDSVTSIGWYAFYNTAYYNNKNNWENKVLYIGKHLIEAKYDISGEYTIKTGTLTIADNALGCNSLMSITIPDSVTSIGDKAFYSCIDLTNITIPNSVTSIGDEAFCFCIWLRNITIPNSVTSIGEYAFDSCKSLTSITIPDSVTSIGKYTFNWCTSLTSITIPDSVTSIGENAFYNTAYYNNENNWENKVLYIGKHLIDAKSDISGEYTIKTGALTIADRAFYECTDLTNITIPNSVTSIGKWAFEDCKNLTEVYYTGTKQDRENIKIGDENWELYNATWYYNYGKTYPDVSQNAWYTDAVTYAVGAGIMSGYSNGKFGTSDSIQRQDFLVMLARLDGVNLNNYKYKSSFPDVARNSYYEAAVNWGAQNGIVTGYQNGKFGVGDKVTREQLVTFLYRYAKYKDYDYSYTSNRETVVSGQYNDYKNVSGFANQPILWAIEKGVISGKTSTTIVPQGNAQRCEVAKIMYNIYLNDIFK